MQTTTETKATKTAREFCASVAKAEQYRKAGDWTAFKAQLAVSAGLKAAMFSR